MADPMSVGSATTPNVDLTKWKKLTPQEILKEESNGEEVPSEIVAWAQQMAALAKVPDDVTYEMVDGDVGIDALNKLGIDEEEQPAPADENAIPPEETEDPEAVDDVTANSDVDNDEENIFMNPPVGDDGTVPPDDETENPDDEDLGLADPSLTTDPEEIRKRKERKGLPQ